MAAQTHTVRLVHAGELVERTGRQSERVVIWTGHEAINRKLADVSRIELIPGNAHKNTTLQILGVGGADSRWIGLSEGAAIAIGSDDRYPVAALSELLIAEIPPKPE